MNSLTRMPAVAVLLVVVAGCTASPSVEEHVTPASAPTVMPTEPPQPTPATEATPLLKRADTLRPLPTPTPTLLTNPPPECAVTLPNGSLPAGFDKRPGEDTANIHGNGVLWSSFWPRNMVLAGPRFIEPDGSIRMKWPWWRAVPGSLFIEGQRLDAPAPPLSAHVYEEGYRGRAFLPSTIYFPTEGCWEVTGSVGDASLTFVTLVLRVVN